MAANISFNIKVLLENPGVLPELHARLADLRPAFEAIYEEWVGLNAQKFQQSVGKEISGADIFDEHWAGLSAGYMRQKHRGQSPRVTKKMARGGAARFDGPFPDWLMVRTGALREALTNPDALFHLFEAQMATFGTPEDPDLADIVRWQASPRQHDRFTVFLSDPDMNAIKRILQDYLGMGGDFVEMRSEAGLAAVRQEKEMNQLDAEFNVAAGGDQ